ncbi:FitA-like ribbon-helix-helix domain-containing protein [Dermacoccaceae bacterium W4C1]
MATVQIRNLDPEAYEALRSRARASGRSLQEYLRVLLEEQATRPTIGEVLHSTRADMVWSPGEPEITMDEVVAAQREQRAR